MAGVTSSSNTTVSPITMAPCAAGANAAQEPSPANAFRGIPSTVTGTSERAQAMRTTPSFVVVALVPAAEAILSASNLGSSLAKAELPTLATPRTIQLEYKRAFILLLTGL